MEYGIFWRVFVPRGTLAARQDFSLRSLRWQVANLAARQDFLSCCAWGVYWRARTGCLTLISQNAADPGA